MKKNIIPLTLGIIFALILRIIFFNIKGPDYYNFLLSWWELINENGKIFALKCQIGDYTPPYIFILAIGTYITKNSLVYIKIVSCIFDFLLALFSFLILKRIFKKDCYNYFLLILFIPGVILNSAVLGQCDAIYTTFILMFVYFMCIQKKGFALLSYGIALSFKLQAIFIAPIFLYLLLTKKIKIYDLAYCILGFLIFNIPSLILGRNLLEIITAYFIQTSEYPEIVQSAPNIYSTFFLNYITVPSIIKFIIILTVLIITIFITLPDKQKTFSNKTFLEKITLLSLLVPYLLPQMQDRYFYMANIFIILFILTLNITVNKKTEIIVVSCICYFLSVFSVNFIDNFVISQYVFISFIASWLNYYIVLSMLSLKNKN